MAIRAYWQFYKDIIIFVLVFTLAIQAFLGYLWAFVAFSTVGIAFGFLAFTLIKKEEFYFYYNLGLTKWKLFKAVFAINFFMGAPIMAIIFILISWLFGDLTIT